MQDNNIADEKLVKLLQDPEHLKTGSFSYELSRLGYDLFGYKSRFDGVSVMLTTRTVDWAGDTPQPKLQPSIVAATNDGTKSLYTNGDIPSTLATRLDFLRNSPTPIQVKLRVQPTAVKVEVHNPTSGQWTTVLDLNQGLNMKPNGVLGFTSFVEKHYDPYKEYDTLKIHDLTVTNYDRNVQIMEESPTVAPVSAVADANKVGDKEDFLYEHSKEKDHKEESEAIHQLTNLVFKLVAETGPVRQQMEQTIGTLQTRIESIEKTMIDLKREINARTGHDLDKEFESIKSELMNLSKTASDETEKRKDKMARLNADLEQLHSTASGGGAATKNKEVVERHIHQLTTANREVIDNLNSGQRWSVMVSLFAVFLIFCGGAALYARFKKWEKKHIL